MTEAFEPMWWTGLSSYAATHRRSDNDVPYTGDHEGVPIKQTDIILHSFDLTASGRIPKPVLRECSENPLIWWKQQSATKKRARRTDTEPRREHKNEDPGQSNKRQHKDNEKTKRAQRPEIEPRRENEKHHDRPRRGDIKKPRRFMNLHAHNNRPYKRRDRYD